MHFKFFAAYLVMLSVAAFCTAAVRAADEGQDDLDKAVEAKLSANTVTDLGEVIRLAESALKKGLDKANTEFADKLLASTLVQRATTVAAAMQRSFPVDQRWMQLRQFALLDLEKAVKLDPKHPQALILITQLNLMPDGDEKRAKEAINQAVEFSADDPRTRSKAPVLIDLTGKFTGQGTVWGTDLASTGSARCDAYLWARRKYLDAGKCDPTTLSYSLDLWALKVNADLDAQLSNLDYAISRKGFCFELTPWGDEALNDDPKQPVGTDRKTFASILDACNQQTQHARMIKFVGFVNWPFKYTKRQGGKHEDVETEWETARFLTAYNCYKEADAAAPSYISNASFYHALLPAMQERRYTQNPAPTRDQLTARGLIGPDGKVAPGNYVCIGLGDYDQASWTLYLLGNERWNDPARGQAVCNWGIDPNAVDRAGVAMDYFYRHKSAKDFFLAWDSGAGYVNPTQLYGKREPSGYPSAVQAWQEHCKHYYRLFDYSISGWLLNGSSGQLGLEDYRNFAPFSGDGIGTQDGRPPSPLLMDNIPVHERYPSDAFPPPLIDEPGGVHFAWYRTITVWPKDLKALEARYARSQHHHRFLDAFTYYYLLRHHLGGTNDYRATWTGDTIPRVMTAGKLYAVSITVRNDGWDTWTDAAGYRIATATVAPGATPANADYDAAGHHPLGPGVTIPPGGTATFSFNLTAPAKVGPYDLYYDMVRDGTTWFRERHNLEWKKPIVVAPDETKVDTDGDGVPDVAETTAGRLWWHPDA